MTQSENIIEKKEKERDEYGNFKQLIVGFVLDVSSIIVPQVKESVLEVIRKHTDRAFVYHPDITEVPLHKGAVVSTLLNFENPGYELGTSVKHSVLTLGLEDGENDVKTLFVITDRANSNDEYRCLRAVAANRNIGVKIVFLCLDSSYSDFNIKEAKKIKSSMKNLTNNMIEELTPKKVSKNGKKTRDNSNKKN
jgi:hypothetical protein